MKLSKDEAKEIVWQNHEDFEDVKDTEEIIGQSRWTTSFSKVVKQLSTGKFFEICWDKGSTEVQDGQEMFYENEVELPEVHQVEKVIMVWESIKEPFVKVIDKLGIKQG